MNNLKSSRHYLLRFIVTLTLALLIPVILFFLAVADMSYKQMSRNNHNFYSDITDSFYAYFENELSSMQTQALQLSVKSAARESGIFSAELLQSNPYHYLKVVEYLAKLTSPFKRYDLFLYYKDLDFVFSSQYKYDLDGFLNREAGRNQKARARLKAFFESESSAQILFSTLDDLELKDAALYVGTPIAIGPGGAPGMLIYKVRYDTINASMFSTQNAHLLDLCVADNEGGILFANSDNAGKFLPTKEFRSVLSKKSAVVSLSLNGETYTLFRANTPPGSNRQYITALPRDTIETGINGFYTMIRRGAILILLLLAALLSATVFINYTPIRRLAKRVGSSSAGGELRIIENAIDRMQSELSEKSIIVMNLLISNLLYGVPIPVEEASRYGLENPSGGACVMTLPGVTFDNQTRERLSSEIAGRFGAKVFITDMLYEDYSVAICLIQDADAEAIQSCLREYIGGAEGERRLFAGEIVGSLNDIQLSYKSCLRLMKRGAPRKTADKANDIQQKLKEDIIQYIDLNFNNPQLNQPMVSDHFGLSVYSLSRFFREHMGGIGFSEYITGKRIAHAKRLLATTNMNVSAIAIEVGIANTNYFSRLFKSNCGMPPLTYRCKMNGSDAVG